MSYSGVLACPVAVALLVPPCPLQPGPDVSCLRRPTDDTYFPQRAAEIILLQPEEADDAAGRRIGTLGVLHPLVLGNFKLDNPVSCFEFSLEPFL